MKAAGRSIWSVTADWLRYENKFMMRKSSFVLIELLVTVSLAILIGASLYFSFGSSISLMRRISNPVAGEEVGIFFEKFEQEV